MWFVCVWFVCVNVPPQRLYSLTQLAAGLIVFAVVHQSIVFRESIYYAVYGRDLKMFKTAHDVWLVKVGLVLLKAIYFQLKQHVYKNLNIFMSL